MDSINCSFIVMGFSEIYIFMENGNAPIFCQLKNNFIFASTQNKFN